MSVLILLSAAAANCATATKNAEIEVCALAEYRRANAMLNRQWAVTIDRVRSRDRSIDRATDKQPGFVAQLLASQQAWLKYRDAECVSEGNVMRGGTDQSLIIILCKTDLTKARTNQLRSYVEKL